jgi:hypothetical protein
MKILHTISFILLLLLTTCTYNTIPSIEDCSVETIELNVANVKSTPCGTDQGMVTVTLNAAIPSDFTYSIDGVNFQLSNEFSGIGAGNYTITARSSGGCIATTDATVTDETNVTLSVTTNEAGCDSGNGEIEATASQAGYRYTIDGINFQESGKFTNLNAGTYTVIAQNENGCGTSQEVTLASGISFESTVKNIIDTNCAISNCHATNSSNGIILATLTDVQKHSGQVKTQVINQTMPPGNRNISQEEINQISCWVDDGALEN